MRNVRAVPSAQRARRTAILAVVAFLSALVVLAPSPPAVGAAICQGKNTAPTSGQSASRRPVILAHGWTSSGTALTHTGSVLAAQTNHRISTFYFDYAMDSTTWAGNNAVSGCLATYINKVSAAYTEAGGDGKVILVGHSMGGLASLYAATTTAAPGTTSHIAGLITFDTPYLGSPFGNSVPASLLQGYKQFFGVNVPPPGSDAQICLANRDEGAPLPAGCDYPSPAYLPSGTPITEIAGQATIRRTLLGIHLYDVSLDTDGIVTTSSSHGYIWGGPGGHPPKGTKTSLLYDRCTITNDQILGLIQERLPPTEQALATDVALSILTDSNAMDGLSTGNLTPGLVAYLATVTVAAPCSHIHVYNDQSALNQATQAIKDILAALTPSTTVVKLAPVDGRGRPAAGWTVGPLGPPGELDCSLPEPSPSAVSGDIYYCSPTAANADACWRSSTPMVMLCLWDPWTRRLSQQQASTDVTSPVKPVTHPYPIGLELSDGDHCRLRNGGSWSRQEQHPDWFGWYACQKHTAVWAPSDAKVINKSSRQWTVQVGDLTGRLSTRRVTRAYYVTTAP